MWVLNRIVTVKSIPISPRKWESVQHGSSEAGMTNIRLRLNRSAVLISGLAFLLSGAVGMAQAQNPPGNEARTSLRPRLPLAGVRLPEVLSDSMGVDFAPYLHQRVLPALRQSWRSVVRQKGLSPSTVWKIVAEFTILKDGTLKDLKLAESSGDPAADEGTLDAINSSAPFAPLPAEFKGESLALRCHLEVFFPNTAPNGVTPPHLVHNVNPDFSDEARRKKIEGVVTLTLVVDTEGQPTAVQVVSPLGHGLDEKAVEAVRRWRFQPAMKDGNPVAQKITAQVSFHLY
jgi:TonB family protein